MVQLGTAHLMGLEEMTDSLGEAAFEKAFDEVSADAAVELVWLEPGPVKKGASGFGMGDKAARLHFSKHGGDGGVGQGPVRLQGGVHFADAGVGFEPEDLEDFQLQIADAMRDGPVHYDLGNITRVVAGQAKIAGFGAERQNLQKPPYRSRGTAEAAQD